MERPQVKVYVFIDKKNMKADVKTYGSVAAISDSETLLIYGDEINYRKLMKLLAEGNGSLETEDFSIDTTTLIRKKVIKK